MRTPAGKECPHYYEDFHRGRNHQECRLLPEASSYWQPEDCFQCPVPDILWANASEHLRLQATIKKGFLGFGRRIDVIAFCRKHNIKIKDPYTGCEQCATDKPNLAAFLNGSQG